MLKAQFKVKQMRATEFIIEDEPMRIKIGGPDPKLKAWIQKVYDLYPQTWQNNHVMPLGGEGDDQRVDVPSSGIKLQLPGGRVEVDDGTGLTVKPACGTGANGERCTSRDGFPRKAAGGCPSDPIGRARRRGRIVDGGLGIRCSQSDRSRD
jgi:hypothetical protein